MIKKARRHLEGVRVIDLTAYLAGPFLTMHLAALGAEVIKIERPGSGDPVRIGTPFAGPRGIGFEGREPQDASFIYLKRNRGKKSITLDLKRKRGVDLFLRLVERGDVVVENFAPGTMESFGLNYEALKKANPRVIYCSISGFGQTGPYRDHTAFDLTIQAMSGMMAMNGYPDGPPLRCGPWIGDQIPALYGIIGILSALAGREKTGEGERIDISMQDCCFSIIMDEAVDMLASSGIPTRQANRNPRATPWTVFPTRDGNITICVYSNQQWKIFLEAIRREECLKDPRFCEPEDRINHMDEVEALVTQWSRGLTTEEALAMLRKRQIPCESVPEIKDVLKDPQLKARGMIQELAHPLNPKTGAIAAAFPIRFLEHPSADLNPAPLLGVNNREVYQGILGLSEKEMEELSREKII